MKKPTGRWRKIGHLRRVGVRYDCWCVISDVGAVAVVTLAAPEAMKVQQTGHYWTQQGVCRIDPGSIDYSYVSRSCASHAPMELLPRHQRRKYGRYT